MALVTASYGPDPNGLIWGYRFSPGKPAEEVACGVAVQELASQTANTDFFWLHFALSSAASESWLKQNIPLPAAFFDAIRSEAGATRLERDDDFLVAVVHDVLFGARFDAANVGSTCLCMGPRLLVSARLRPLRSVDQLRETVRGGAQFNSPVELLARLLSVQADVLSDILRSVTRHVDEVEDGILANRSSTTRAQLGTLRRSLVRLQRLLAPEPAALFRLLNKPPDWIKPSDVGELQQAAEEFSAAIHDSSALVERVKLIQEEMAALNNEQTARTLFVLTIVTVLALPINLVAGLFGMNVGGIPLAANEHGFRLIVVLLVLLTGTLAWFAWRRRK
jgi:zinc transporter